MSFFKSSTLPLKALKRLVGSPLGRVNRVVQDDENDEGPKSFRLLQVKLCVKVFSVYISNQRMLQLPLPARDLASGQLVDCGWGIGLGLSTGTSLSAAGGRPIVSDRVHDFSDRRKTGMRIMKEREGTEVGTQGTKATGRCQLVPVCRPTAQTTAVGTASAVRCRLSGQHVRLVSRCNHVAILPFSRYHHCFAEIWRGHVTLATPHLRAACHRLNAIRHDQ